MRGIPVYARELEVCLRRLGVEHRELRAPAWVARTPRFVQNILFVLFEQFVAPIARILQACDLTVYPYNSAGAVDALVGRSVMVIHDLIPNRRDSRGLAALYIRACQAWHARLGRPLAAVSRHTLRQLGRIERFRRCEKYYWANPFYAFEDALARGRPAPAPAHDAEFRILLCSGIGANKDYGGALHLLRRTAPRVDAEIRVLGFGEDAELARRRLASLPEAWRGRITVLPRLSLDGTVSEFASSDLVWVHSRAEGFGRPVMEARMCGKPVIASDIGAFRQLRRFRHVHLYKNDSFAAVWQEALADADSAACTAASAQAFNRQLEEEVQRLLAGMSR